MTWDWNTPVEKVKEELATMEQEIEDLDAFRYFTPVELENLILVAEVLNVAIQKIKMMASNKLKEQQEGD
jgi:hypothetical protein